MPLTLFEPAPDTPLRERLLDIARAFFAMVMAPAAIAGHRMMCAPQGITPELALMFWEAGPARIQVELAAMLSRHDQAGELTIADARLAAAQFLTLIKGDIHPRLMIGIECDESATARHLESAVDLFLRGYRP
ncbi:TetR/AcrR family transcriptional regulator C-terminal domain-containing protein [Solilutibacter pythonis]